MKSTTVQSYKTPCPCLSCRIFSEYFPDRSGQGCEVCDKILEFIDFLRSLKMDNSDKTLKTPDRSGHETMN